MDWNVVKKQSNALLGGLACILVVLSWVFPRQATPSAEVVRLLNDIDGRLAEFESEASVSTAGETRPRLKVDEGKQFEEAITLAQERLNSGAFSEAYDLLLVASRLRPSDPRLLDHVIAFIDTARKAETDEGVELADDLAARADSLVHFQHPKNVASARKRFAAIAHAEVNVSVKKVSPFAEILDLLAVAESSSLPFNTRTRAAEQARRALDDASVTLAAANNRELANSDAEEINKLQVRLEKAEHACVAGLFLKTKERAEQWLADADKLTTNSETIDVFKVPEFAKQMSDAITAGVDLSQELGPFAKATVAGATELAKQVEKKVTSLQRRKAWLYNQQVLRLIRDIESRDLAPEEKLRHLAEVSEEHLAPYILRRHNEYWDKVFEELKDEDQKVAAVKLRILKVKE